MPANYEYYRIFYYVAKYQSFTGAAGVLLSNQPNVTRAMNNLEQELGCRLFLRSHRGVSLTPEGEKLYAYVRIAQEQLQAAENELASGKNLQSGSVSVGSTESALHMLLLPVLRRFRHTYPGIRLRIANHATTQAVAALRSGLVELAVVTTPTGVSGPLQELPLKPFQEILIAGPGFAALAAQRLTLRALTEYPLICLERESKTFALYDRLFAQNGLALQPDIEVATMDQILPMVQNDLGLGFLPRAMAQEALEKGEVFEVPLAQAIPVRQVCLVKDRSRPQSIAARELEQMLRQAAVQ